MLIQVQLQDVKTGETEMIEQFYVKDDESGEETYKKVDEIVKRHGRPPVGSIYAVCNENSPFFKWMAEESLYHDEDVQ